MSKYLVIANWKMNPSNSKEAKILFIKTKKHSSNLKKTKVIVCPPNIYLSILQSGRSNNFFLGSQDVFWKNSGAFTGEISSIMLKNLKVSFCIIGHSERRMLGETDEMVSYKIKALLSENITPVLCIGERERDNGGNYLRFLSDQIKSSLKGTSRSDLSKIVIAYEPIWAIGRSSKDAIDSHKLHEMVIYIKKVLSENFGRESASKTRIIYGGSVEAKNAPDLIKNGNIGGFLVGHASLTDQFKEVLKSVDITT